jgi:signal transduction histidine kinase
MEPDVRARALEPFFTTKAPGEGTGLGLSLVYSIVMDHGGAVAIDSEPGAGTAVWISLPQHDTAAAGSPS